MLLIGSKASSSGVGAIATGAAMASATLAAPPLHREEGSGTAPLLELFRWNAINIRELAFSYARFTLCGDTLTTAHGLHAALSAV